MGKLSYLETGIQDEIKVIPYAQFLNPIKHTLFGIGIKKDQGDLAQFTPDQSWKLETAMIGDNQQEIYYCTTPRLLILAQSDVMMSNGYEIIKYDRTQKEEGFSPLSYMVFWPVDKDNNPLSNLPFRIKTSSMAGKSLRDVFKQWQTSLMSAYSKIEGSTKGLTWSAGVFESKWHKGTTKTPDGKLQTIAEIESFTLITVENIEQYYILPNSDVGRSLVNIKQEVADWCNLINSKPQTQETVEDNFDYSITDLRLTCEEKFTALNFLPLQKNKYVEDNFHKKISQLDKDDLEALSLLLDQEMTSEAREELGF